MQTAHTLPDSQNLPVHISFSLHALLLDRTHCVHCVLSQQHTLNEACWSENLTLIYIHYRQPFMASPC